MLPVTKDQWSNRQPINDKTANVNTNQNNKLSQKKCQGRAILWILCL